jgi:protein-disulfide isomerase
MRTQKTCSAVTQSATIAPRAYVIAIAACLSLGAVLAGCSDQKAAAAAPSKAATPASPNAGDDIPAVLAEVGSEKITLADVRSRVGDNLDQLEARYRQNRFALIDKTLQEILRDRVLGEEAKKQGKTIDQLVEAEIGGSVEPTETEISQWYLENRARLGGRTLDQIKPQVVDLLRQDRRKKAMAKLEERVNKDRQVTIHLEPYRYTLNNEGAPARGPADARVTFVEFSDFQCPFCGRFFPVMKQLEEKYGDKVRIVYRQYPIPSLHPNAFKAAEASLCANDQGKFWELHDAMFQAQEQLTVRELKEKAGRLGLDQKKFDSCLDTGRYTEQVQEDIKEGGRIGVTGTPALFVNGVQIEGGSVPFDVVAKVIDKELARASR